MPSQVVGAFASWYWRAVLAVLSRTWMVGDWRTRQSGTGQVLVAELGRVRVVIMHSLLWRRFRVRFDHIEGHLGDTEMACCLIDVELLHT